MTATLDEADQVAAHGIQRRATAKVKGAAA